MIVKKLSVFLLSFALLTCFALTSALDSSADTAIYNAKGTASWFGHWHHGKTTASGEPFDMFAMTAAHRTLPFGTVLKVTNSRNGREVLVRVNDRGPYRKKRIIDLSFGAAEKLGMRSTGVASVVLEQVGDAKGLSLDKSKAFFVRLNMDDAAHPEAALSALIKIGFVEAAEMLHKADGVAALGPFDCFEDAQETLNRVATTHPLSSIMLADKKTAEPVVSTQAVFSGF